MFVFLGSLRLKIGTECLEDRAEPLKFTSFEDRLRLEDRAEPLRITSFEDRLRLEDHFV